MVEKYFDNSFDSVQTIDKNENSVLQELTVTITLAEYRELLQTVRDDINEISRLEETNKRLADQNNAFSTLLYAKSPEIKQKLAEVMDLLSDEIKAIFAEGEENG